MRQYLSLIVISLGWIIADQVSKLWAVASLLPGALPERAEMLRRTTEVYVVHPAWFKFELAGNKGAAWSIFANMSESFRVPFFLVLTSVAIGLIFVLYRKTPPDQRLMRTALAFVMGGAIGNLIDRALRGYVIDFISWHYGDEWAWPTFNIADVAISVGVGLLLIDAIFQKKPPEEEASPEDATTQGQS